MLSWLGRRGVRLASASAVAVEAQDFQSKHELCRRIRRLAVRDRKRRSARILERVLCDTELAVMIRLEAARVLARWGLVLPAARRLLQSQGEIPSLKTELSLLVADAEPVRTEEKVPA